MPRPHLKYRQEDYPQSVIDATNDLFNAKPWRLEIGNRVLFEQWATTVSAAYDVPVVSIEHTPGAGRAQYDYLTPDDDGQPFTIRLNKMSIATLFCAMGHHICSEGPVLLSPYEWAYSLFYSVKPVMFRRRVREGRIVGLTAKDTFTSDTWAQLQAIGLTNGDNLLDPQFDIRTLESVDDLINPEEIEDSDESEELAPVISLTRSVPEQGRDIALAQFSNYSITELRRASRGVISGGYNMSKADLINALIDAGVNHMDVWEANR